MRVKTGFRGLLLTAVVLNGGCSDSLTSGESDASLRPVASVSPDRMGRPAFRTLDEQMLDLAKEVPGFGGMFYDENGVLQVYLTELSGRDRAALAIAEFLRGRRPMERGGGNLQSAARTPIRFRRGNFDYAQLFSWQQHVNRVVFSIPGVVFTDIDEARNALTVAVTDAGVAERVRAELVELRLPRRALDVVISGPIRSFQEELKPIGDGGGSGSGGGSSQSLREHLRPVLGGLGIDLSPTSPNPWRNCTAGFNAYTYWGTPVLVTNSHCTQTPAMLEGEAHYQGGSIIGYEIADAPPFDHVAHGSCPVDRWCRWSDAALIGYQSGVSWDFAKSAFTGLPYCTTGPCDFTMEGKLQITFKHTLPPLHGETVNKTGQRTGWTRGQITNTCVTQSSQQRADLGYLIYLCQYVVGAHADAGDSGSPVYTRYTTVAGEPGEMWLYGILWGGDPVQNWYVFSPMENIEIEYGWLYVY